MQGLKKLETLSLYLPKVTDVGLVHLKGLKTLRVLNLSGTRVTDAGLPHLKGLALTRLELTYTGITGAVDLGRTFDAGGVLDECGGGGCHDFHPEERRSIRRPAHVVTCAYSARSSRERPGRWMSSACGIRTIET